MSHYWMLDVLTDLKKFASKNGLDDLADQIAVCHQTAKDEMELCKDGDTDAPASGPR